jgi:hypothetical protein
LPNQIHVYRLIFTTLASIFARVYFFGSNELIKRLNDIEWKDFECKAARKLPDNGKETVLAF